MRSSKAGVEPDYARCCGMVKLRAESWMSFADKQPSIFLSTVNRRLNILLSAYYCSPYKGSESAVGWQTAIALAKEHNITVLCGDLKLESPTGKDIEHYCQQHELPSGLKICHVQIKGIASVIHRLHSLPGLWFLYYVAYRLWQLQAFEEARKIHAEQPFDLAHHLTIIGYREPGYLWKLNIPFIWGPVAGASTVPLSFIADFGLKERFRWTTHHILNRIQISLGGRPERAAQAAAHVWAVSRKDQNMFKRWGRNAELMAEYGTEPIVAHPKTYEIGQKLLICWSGLFQGSKALHLLLLAIVSLPHSLVELHILGEGPEEARWKQLACKLGLSGILVWHGKLPRDEALETMNTSHVQVITSLKEASSVVTFEALERGIPVICHDACGMGIAIDESCGIKVPLQDPATSIKGFKKAIERLIAEPGLLTQLSQGALARSNYLSRESNINRINKTYEVTISK